MNKYLIILTKSRFVADQLRLSFKPGEDGVVSVASGSNECTSRNWRELIPPIYRTAKYYHCAVTYIESADLDPYRIVVA